MCCVVALTFSSHFGSSSNASFIYEQLRFFSDADGVRGSAINRFIGNITSDSEVTVRYGINRDGGTASIVPCIVCWCCLLISDFGKLRLLFQGM